jgi:hypothetical protein
VNDPVARHRNLSADQLCYFDQTSAGDLAGITQPTHQDQPALGVMGRGHAKRRAMVECVSSGPHLSGLGAASVT